MPHRQFIDPITKIEIRSDKVYGEDSAVLKGLKEAEFFCGCAEINQVEYELSNKALILTGKGTVVDDNGLTQDLVTRVVFKGDFERGKKSGRLSGRLDNFIEGSYETVSDERFSWTENEFIGSLKDDTIKGEFKNSRQFEKAGRALASIEPSPDTVQIWYLKNFNEESIKQDAEKGFYTTFDPDKSGLKAIGSSRFFVDEWWSNPFDSDLA
jgi:hypothetical protein